MIGQKLLKMFTFWLVILFLNPDWLIPKGKLISIYNMSEAPPPQAASAAHFP